MCSRYNKCTYHTHNKKQALEALILKVYTFIYNMISLRNADDEKIQYQDRIATCGNLKFVDPQKLQIRFAFS